MTDHHQAAVDALASEIWRIVQQYPPHFSMDVLAVPILDLITPIITAPLQAELNRYREDSHTQSLTINRLAMAAEDRTVVDIARHKAHQAELDAAYAEAHACGAERETWKDRAEDAEAKLALAVEVLGFYAGATQEQRIFPNQGPWGAASTDFGNAARAALAAINGETK